tara:strand:- start:4540 stop:5973 length:1434 start_codon:yes stop_codon:yes gene_type:complete
MKYLLTMITVITIGYSQSFTVENVQASQSTDGEHVLTVTYDLVSDGTYPSFMVHPEISIDGGDTWNYIIMSPIENILGDNIFAGTGKTFSIDLDDYYTGMYTNNALVKIKATGRESVNLPSSFDNLFVTVEAGEYMGGNISIHGMYGESEEFQIKNLDYTYEISKYYVTNAQYAEFLIDVYNQGLITITWDNWSTGGYIRGAFHGYGVDAPLLQEDCEYSYQPGYELGDGYQNDIWGYGDPNSNCHNGYDWYKLPGSYNGKNGQIRFNGTTFVVDEGFGNHPVNNITPVGAMAFAHYYGLRVPNKEEVIKAGNGMNSWDYVWGETPHKDSPKSELAKYMNFSGHNQDCSTFNNPWAPQDNYNSRMTTPVGYFNGSTYYYPDGFIDNSGENCEPIYEIQTENAVSPYGLYDANGNVSELTSTFLPGANSWEQNFIRLSGSGTNDQWGCQTTTQWAAAHHSYSDQWGFRLARTINTTND